MAQAQRKANRPTMKRKKNNSGNQKLLIVAGLGVVGVIVIGYLLFSGGNSPSSGFMGQARDINDYDTMLQNNAHWKRSELRESGRDDSQTQRQITWLTNITTITSLIPWESTYFVSIPAEDVKENAALSSLRIDLINRFQFVREKFDIAIGDPSDGNISDAMTTLRSNKQLIRDAIGEVRSKSSAIGSKHSETITKCLNMLLDEMDSSEYE